MVVKNNQVRFMFIKKNAEKIYIVGVSRVQ